MFVLDLNETEPLSYTAVLVVDGQCPRSVFCPRSCFGSSAWPLTQLVFEHAEMGLKNVILDVDVVDVVMLGVKRFDD